MKKKFYQLRTTQVINLYEVRGTTRYEKPNVYDDELIRYGVLMSNSMGDIEISEEDYRYINSWLINEGNKEQGELNSV